MISIGFHAIVNDSGDHEDRDRNVSWFALFVGHVLRNFLDRAVPEYLSYRMLVPPQPTTENCRVFEAGLGSVP